MRDQKKDHHPAYQREVTALGFEITRDGSKKKTRQLLVSRQSLSTVKPKMCCDNLEMPLQCQTEGDFSVKGQNPDGDCRLRHGILVIDADSCAVTRHAAEFTCEADGDFEERFIKPLLV
jgi:hypothetical protein